MLRNYDLLSAEVNLIGVIKARTVIDRYLNRTNLTYYSELSRLAGCEVFVKHENHNPTGSFKIRGALNFFHHMSKEELERGVLVATRGNHGLAMAWAAQWFHVPCTVVVPENNNPEINRIVESLGADLITHGNDFYDAQSYCDELVDSAGYYYVEQGNEPEILNGLGTMGLEILRGPAGRGRHHLPHRRRFGMRLADQGGPGHQPEGGDHRSAGGDGRLLSTIRGRRASGSPSKGPTPWPTVWRRGASSSSPTRS